MSKLAALMLGICLVSNLSVSAQSTQQYVLLISLDGYRYDYTDRFQPLHLRQFLESGTKASAMIPVFPSKTFPNHYSIATGMRTAHHGLVDNLFYDPNRDQVYKIGNREAVQDGSWYGGTPLWVQAEKNQLPAASFFFIGSEADIQGIRPRYYFDYDGTVSNQERVSQVLQWYELPEKERPKLITLYFSDIDDIGHRYGPNNKEKLQEAIHSLDKELGRLFEGIKETGLPINTIVVSDHGMMEIRQDRLINIQEMLEPFDLKYYNNGALTHLYLEDPADRRKVKKGLKGLENIKLVHPTHKKYYGKGPQQFEDRMGDLLVIPEDGYYLVETSGFIKYQNRAAMFKTEAFGEHGFHPDNKDMGAIFYANGPAFREGMEIEPFENIHIFPLICEILGIPIPKEIDGDLSVLAPILKVQQ